LVERSICGAPQLFFFSVATRTLVGGKKKHYCAANHRFFVPADGALINVMWRRADKDVCCL
jgi:hypothetical protein